MTTNKRYAVIRANLNNHGDHDWLIYVTSFSRSGTNTVCGSKASALAFDTIEAAYIARDTAETVSPTYYASNRRIDWRVVELNDLPSYFRPIEVARPGAGAELPSQIVTFQAPRKR